MGALKWVGYTAAAILVLTALIAGGALITAFLAVAGVALAGAAVIAFTAFCIRDYCESKKTRRE